MLIEEGEEERSEDLPLRAITHGKDELCTYEENAGESEDNEYVQPDPMAEWIELRI